MAGRFVFHKLASRMSGSTSLLCARASAASARDVAPLTRCASEGGIGALSSLFHESAAHPCTVVASSRVMLSYAAKCLNPLPCSCLAAKMSNPTAGMPSHHTKPASVDSVGGVKRTFSSSSSEKSIGDRWEGQKAASLAELEAGKETLSESRYEAEKAAIIAEWKAEMEAAEARVAAHLEKFKEEIAVRSMMIVLLLAQAIIDLSMRFLGKKSQAAAGDAAEESVGDNAPVSSSSCFLLHDKVVDNANE